MSGVRRPALLIAWLASAAALSACESFVPLREPPPLAVVDPPGNATTRDEVVARFGPPDEVRASDIGEVLVYRRPVVIENNPNRYYGIDRGSRLDRYERVLLYLDGEGRIVRWATELE
jgi:hypothetical protein